MILAFTRGIRRAISWQEERKWKRVRAYPEIRGAVVELTGSTMGIVGFGASGREVAKRALAFGMDVIALDLYPESEPDDVEALWPVDRLHDLLAQSDYVVVAVPYTSRTDGMIGAEEIAKMKPSAMLVCISRGRIVDEEALAAALRGGDLAAAALDVFAEEPLPPESDLWQLDNLLITPHIAGLSQFEGQRILDIFRENLDRYLDQDFPLRNQVDKQRGF
jgi:phosphoglycerate dehydrogenase-like enzyme